MRLFTDWIDAAVAETTAAFARINLRKEQLAVTFGVIDNGRLCSASHRGDEPIYPASVVKLFYLVAAHAWLEHGKIGDTAELQRALHHMIVDSSNDATHYVVDLLTGTTGGPELPAAQMAEWEEKRNAVNRFFAKAGYRDININQKTWCDGPYGREKVAVTERANNRNALTTNATARLLASIALGECVSTRRSAEMLELLRRDVAAERAKSAEKQHAFIAPALSDHKKLWSKAGWTSETRHDAAIIQMPSGRQAVLVIFTINHAGEREIIPALAERLLARWH